MLDQAIHLMQELGFSGYEAKAYIGTLEGQPVGAYELAKRSNVPTSKIYETLNKLLSKEVIQFAENNAADNPTYVALPPKDLIERINRQTTHKTSNLLPLLGNLQSSKTPDFIWPIATIGGLKEKSVGILQSAKKSVWLSCWPEELVWLETELNAAITRGVEVALVHFGTPNRSIGATYHHPVEKSLYSEKGGRGLTLVSDAEEVVIANLSADGSFDACWSKNSAFVTVAEDYVKHDVYITKVTKHLGAEVIARYGEDYQKLRNIYQPEA